MGFNFINWNHICGLYFLDGSPLEKCNFLWKISRFSGKIWPDWGNTAWVNMAGLGSIGLLIVARGWSSMAKALVCPCRILTKGKHRANRDAFLRTLSEVNMSHLFKMKVARSEIRV